MTSFLERKVEEIRQEPEHVRLRYVWGGVGFIMACLFLFWVMMLRDGFRTSAQVDSRAINDIMPANAGNLVQDGRSIGQMVGNAQSLVGEGLSAANASAGNE